MALIASLAAIPITALAALKLRGGNPTEDWDPERYLSGDEAYSDAETGDETDDEARYETGDDEARYETGDDEAGYETGYDEAYKPGYETHSSSASSVRTSASAPRPISLLAEPAHHVVRDDQRAPGAFPSMCSMLPFEDPANSAIVHRSENRPWDLPGSSNILSLPQFKDGMSYGAFRADDTFHRDLTTSDRLVYAGEVTDKTTGETHHVFENDVPPPTGVYDRTVGGERRLEFLQGSGGDWKQRRGGYAQRPGLPFSLKEQEGPEPRFVRGNDRCRVKDMVKRDIDLNMNGIVPEGTRPGPETWDRVGGPDGMIGTQGVPKTHPVPYMPATQRGRLGQIDRPKIPDAVSLAQASQLRPRACPTANKTLKGRLANAFSSATNHHQIVDPDGLREGLRSTNGAAPGRRGGAVSVAETHGEKQVATKRFRQGEDPGRVANALYAGTQHGTYQNPTHVFNRNKQHAQGIVGGVSGGSHHHGAYQNPTHVSNRNKQHVQGIVGGVSGSQHHGAYQNPTHVSNRNKQHTQGIVGGASGSHQHGAYQMPTHVANPNKQHVQGIVGGASGSQHHGAYQNPTHVSNQNKQYAQGIVGGASGSQQHGVYQNPTHVSNRNKQHAQGIVGGASGSHQHGAHQVPARTSNQKKQYAQAIGGASGGAQHGSYQAPSGVTNDKKQNPLRPGPVDGMTGTVQGERQSATRQNSSNGMSRARMASTNQTYSAATRDHVHDSGDRASTQHVDVEGRLSLEAQTGSSRRLPAIAESSESDFPRKETSTRAPVVTSGFRGLERNMPVVVSSKREDHC